MNPFSVFAPGKLFVMGEYAVLGGGRALVVAIDAGIRCAVSESDRGWWISAPDLGLDLSLDAAARADEARLLAAAAAAGAAELRLVRPLALRIEGSTSVSRRKRGLGGSAASVVAVLAALATAGGENVERRPTRRRLFKLASSVHRDHQQGRGSGADVAASINGGWVDFALCEGGARIETARVPAGLRLSAAWTGAEVDTSAAVAAFQAAPAVSRHRLLAALDSPLRRFWKGLERGAHREILDAVTGFGEALERIGAGAPDRVRDLVAAAREAGAAAKGSGAAGGDSVIAVAFDAATIAAVEERWRGLGAEVLPVAIDRAGVRREAAGA